MEQLHAIIRGHLQGVNFRATTRQQAQHLGLTGWVRNNPDGTVEVLAEGPRPALESLRDFLQQGPPPPMYAHWSSIGKPLTVNFRAFQSATDA